ncbi:MAG: hypothetical protein GX444_06305 [Myxococcales bacterium]|nr:hypothetical protein [Myxococcales bacterium]
MKRAATILTIALMMVASFWLSGCLILQEDDKADELPMRGYGTFKMSVDDVGPSRETDEGGVFTGRQGFYFDINQDEKPDLFYQIKRPSAGIIALSFGADGYASGGLPVAMASLKPGQTEYEIPLESLTEWIKADQALGYRKGQYLDDKDMLVYTNRIFDSEMEAPMTGGHQFFNYQLVSLGVYNAGSGGSAAQYEDESLDGENEQLEEPFGDEENFTPAATGDADVRCGGWKKHCEKLESCDHFGADWSVAECTDRLTSFAFGKYAPSQRYLTCINECSPNASCDKFMKCRNKCWDEQYDDAYGCESSYGPDANDVVFIVERNGQYYKESPGYTLQDGEKMAIYVDYKDVEGDFGGGKVTVTGGAKKVVYDVPNGPGRSSFEDKALVGVTIQTPLPKGDYQLVFRLKDSTCGREGQPFRIKFSSAGVKKGDNEAIQGSLNFEEYEVFQIAIDKYNMGKGFLDAAAIKSYTSNEFLYELMEFDVAIVQAYIWSMTGKDSFGMMSMDDLNSAIFTTTHDTKGTKFDETDDIQAMAFYIDQPMTPGLFTFYGDEGWNIYPVGPYGDNEDQPFMRGDFESTTVHIPFAPFTTVSTEYTGSADACEYYLDLLYGEEVNGAAPGFDTKADALENCKNHSASNYWLALMRCMKTTDDGQNGCVSLDACLKGVGTPGSGQRISDVTKEIPLNITVTIPPEFLASETYGPMLTEAGRLKVGVLGQAVTGWEVMPGTSVDFNINRTEYSIPLPYMPLVPERFIQISTPESSRQAQLYFGLYDPETKSVLATNWNEPSEVYEDGEWFYLLIYSLNWVDPAQEGWALGVVSENTIYSFVDPYTSVANVTFGDLRAIQEDNLKP